ncbi:hypothetical protein GCM10028796_54740 [Ramlibacter monticola]|uniref:Uncharacterized protein n=1 Tax=Ramlibacter monticola TaxID=1926872 RepID=A0A936Z4D1_9BURK|nr:hypothetical protein [Ramlibacter monticola]MBL0394808.1 hypothetical protein [Ramlibacter monticola]
MSKVFLSPATFVGGSLAGALLLAAWFGAFTRAPEPAPAPTSTHRAAVAAQGDGAPVPPPQVGAAVATPAQDADLAASCPSQVLLAPGGGGDGRFALEAVLSSAAQVEPSAYLAVARESAQHGQLHDAEVALLAACHAAERVSGSHSVAVADLKTRIAQQYVALAASEAAGAARDELLKRAATLLSKSAITYSAALGREASKTRLAEQRLASLHDPATLQRARTDANADPGTSVMGAAPRSSEEASERTTGPRGEASRLVSSDPELAQLESDLRRLHAQASSVTRDPAGLRRRDSQALAQRDAACEDKACLLRWYAQRRHQLLDEF